jgi:spore coat protein YutH
MQRTDWEQWVETFYPTDAFSGRARLMIQPLDRFFLRNLRALAWMADGLMRHGGFRIWQPIRNRAGNYVTERDGTPVVLMAAVPSEEHPLPSDSAGGMLARFHRLTSGIDRAIYSEPLRDRTVPDWIREVSVLETGYRELIEKKERTAFEQIFFQTFPYFSGCAENAIQLVADAAIDFPVRDAPVLIHRCFSGFGSAHLENPACWMVGDRTRDLAAWLRRLIWRETGDASTRAAARFLDDYERVFPLSSRSIAELFGQLLYPSSFVSCVLSSFSEETQAGMRSLERIMQLNEAKITDQERFISTLIRKAAGRFNGPEWLSGSQSMRH